MATKKHKATHTKLHSYPQVEYFTAKFAFPDEWLESLSAHAGLDSILLRWDIDAKNDLIIIGMRFTSDDTAEPAPLVQFKIALFDLRTHRSPMSALLTHYSAAKRELEKHYADNDMLSKDGW